MGGQFPVRRHQSAGGARPAPVVVALVASAGGLAAFETVLETLPPGFPAAVVVGQHLSSHGSSLVEILQRRSRLPVAWARDRTALEPGRVVIAPPMTAIVVRPDSTVSLVAAANSARSGPLDIMVNSLAESFGDRGAAVVLSGMGRDGSLGVRALREAGGTVVAQSEESARFTGMPRAAVEAGAELVLDVQDIGPMLVDLVHAGARGTPTGANERTNGADQGDRRAGNPLTGADERANGVDQGDRPAGNR